MFDRLRRAWQQAKAQLVQANVSASSAANNPAVAAYRVEVLSHFPYTDEAKRWLSSAIGFEVEDLHSTRGGGYWYPDQNKVYLFTAQYEAAIHELAHARWHYRRQGREDTLIEATIALSQETDPRYERLTRLAYGYVHGIPEQHCSGTLSCACTHSS